LEAPDEDRIMTECTRRHAVVTGCASGIGRAIALRLAADGFHVFAGVRRPADGTDLADDAPGTSMLTPVILDVTDSGQISSAVQTVRGHVARRGLDALVDNAGIGISWPMELIPLAELRRQLEVNVVGQVAVAQGFLPLIREAAGRIIMLGSIGDRLTIPFGGPLNASKYAVRALTDALRLELAPWDIRVILIEPASIRTPAVDKLAADADRAVAAFPPPGRDLYAATYLGVVRRAVAHERNGSDPSIVAATIAGALSARRPRRRYLVGQDAHVLAMLSLLPGPLLDAVRRRIFGLPRPGARVVDRNPG
jgi:NAD(P)-dependent dehydrogenase (short-subunit alcohol dehydrogenase family)